MKLEAYEESAPEVMTSSEASSSEARSPEAEGQQKMKKSKCQRLFKSFNHA